MIPQSRGLHALPQYEAARRAAVEQNERQMKEAQRLQQDGPQANQPGEHGAAQQLEQPSQDPDNIIQFPPQVRFGGFGRWMMWVAVSLVCAAALAFILSEVEEMESEQRNRDGRRERQYPTQRYRQQRRRSYDWDGDGDDDGDDEDEDDRPRRRPQRTASRRGTASGSNRRSSSTTPPTQNDDNNDDSGGTE